MQRLTTLGMLSGLAIAATAIAGGDAQAHFRLEAPAAMTEQNQLGDPQKVYPCGGDGSAVPTGEVSTYTAGETITITISEEIYHPGHYRVALAENDVGALPADPPITPGPGDDCAMTEIMDPPVYPVIADGMLAHSEPFEGEQSFEVTLPADVSCDNCTLQVVQYMSSHAAPCFYYHCANIAIQPAEGGSTTGEPGTTTETTGDAGSSSSSGAPDPTGDGAGTTGGVPPTDPSTSGEPGAGSSAGESSDTPEPDSSSDGCSAGGTGRNAGLLFLVPLLFAARRRG